MVKKQLRILIADTGSSFAVLMANAFCLEGDWAIVRPQHEDILTETVEKEQPDLLILDAAPLSLDLTEYVPFLQSRFPNLTVLVLIHRRNSFIEKLLREMGVMCRRYPENPTELRADIRAHFSEGTDSTRRIEIPDPEIRLTRLLHSIGIPANLRGFHYLRAAIRCALNEPFCCGCMMHRIYPAVAEEMHSTPARVERSIRNAIAHAYETECPDDCPLLFSSAKRRWKNSEFISLAVEYLRDYEHQRSCG